MVEWSNPILRLTLASVTIIVVVALVVFTLQVQMGQPGKQQEDVGPSAPGLPPFANQDFDMVVTPAIVSVSEAGGSVRVQVELVATRLATSETLVLETGASIPGYSASFAPTSVTLRPGASAHTELTVTIPNGVQNGTYSVSVMAKGENTRGGAWLLITIGSSQTVPPP